MPLDISNTKSFDVTRIFFNGILHLAFRHDDVVGIGTWKTLNGCKYVIEITFRGGATMTVEYDREEKFQRVIEIISESL